MTFKTTIRILALLYVFLGVCAFMASLILFATSIAPVVWAELIAPHLKLVLAALALFVWWLAWLYVDASITPFAYREDSRDY